MRHLNNRRVIALRLTHVRHIILQLKAGQVVINVL